MCYHENILLFFLLFTVVQSNDDELCYTPKNEPGECVLLKSCPTLIDMLKDKTDSSMEYVKHSICGFAGIDSKVCCVYQSNSSNPIEENGHKQNSRQLLANGKFCGYQHSDDYEHITTGTIITEFPWLARIVHRKKDESSDSYQKRYLCLGSLLNTRYILTAANCIVQPVFIPIKVQLGEYHIANDTDCVTDNTNIEECSDPTIWYGIEKVIAHSDYNSKNYTNDIALIRLNGKVTYSDYIRPICLPYPGTVFANIGNTLTTSGWGYINSKRDKATIKKKVLGTLISNNKCIESYSKFNARITLTEKHLCTVIYENSTELSCVGDSGAPVIFQHKLQWHQEGIVSFGQAGCGSAIPEVHTRVEKYLDWIEENIEA